jgi:hypothetical protein
MRQNRSFCPKFGSCPELVHFTVPVMNGTVRISSSGQQTEQQKELHKVTDRGSLLRLSLKIDNGYFYLFLSPELAVTA